MPSVLFSKVMLDGQASYLAAQKVGPKAHIGRVKRKLGSGIA